MTKTDPLIKLSPPQEEVFWKVDQLGMCILVWRRQLGKTTTLASISLRRMLEKVGHTITYCSASISVGEELLWREAMLWHQAIDNFRTQAGDPSRLQTTGDNLSEEDFVDIFSKQKLEVKIYHSRTQYSRTRILAPNPATARGFSGDVIIDEIGFIRDLQLLWEAMEPIASRDPDFRVLMATTFPDDDSHYSYELIAPKDPVNYRPSAKGHWYQSEPGIQVHRCDVYDGLLAGVELYSLNEKRPISPEEHRKQSINRAAWDRNYALIPPTGGTSAVSLLVLNNAMERGRTQCLAAQDDLPSHWRSFVGEGQLALGVDPATTTKETSNPTSITLMEKTGGEFFARLIFQFKSDDPDTTLAIIRELLDNGEKKVRRICVDATNERFWATSLKKTLAGVVPVELVISSESMDHGGERHSKKAFLGNQLVNAMEDNLVSLPCARWIKDDWRLVKRDRGTFQSEVSKEGMHGDTFDSTKLAIHGLISRSGPAQAEAVSTGAFARSMTSPQHNPRLQPQRRLNA